MRKSNIWGIILFLVIMGTLPLLTKKQAVPLPTETESPPHMDTLPVPPKDTENTNVLFIYFTAPSLSASTVTEIENFYHIKIFSIHMRLPSDIGRDRTGRLSADAAIEYLKSENIPGYRILVGMVSGDISIKTIFDNDWGVYGVSDGAPGRTCIVSTARASRKHKGVLITLLHEIGHCFGLEHCLSKDCLMQGGGAIPLRDDRPYLCNKCKTILKFSSKLLQRQ